MAMVEDLAHIIIDTLNTPILLAAKQIKDSIKLTEVSEQEIINSIESFRAKRKGLENCCIKLFNMQRDRTYKFPAPEDDLIDDGILRSLTTSGLIGNWNMGGYPFRRP